MIRYYYRLARVILHLVAGLAACALFFPWAGAAWRDRTVQRWSRRLLAIAGVRVRQEGGVPALEHAMIVANHVSWLDIFVINSLHPCHFVAKSEIREWPVLGWLAEKGGTVFLARGNRRELRHIFKGMVAALQAGERVAFFPEGTTAAQGTVLPFHANLFEAAVDAGVLVQPYAVRYLDQDGGLHAAVDFTGDTTFAQSMKAVLSGPPIEARLTCLAPLQGAGAHRRELAQAAHNAVAAVLER
ncbi:1-acyl-sn-glycerol-3-phosphate acyltransferase [Massilia sp. PAMC28688]|uniref:lysophospholipid acyltransferase family protein n=1 Tax=Massilia sp. PAMC28688 TaxID=2861283 RepID=UPI001C62A8C5|nr:lysophospholipid acyltransferase family protein [Massilia sp. PAMC28688]QYF91631.1 1-acyl-sn-glycerol-3-phosphate acyltransferase [Massilia sp. PAMC28688]